MLQPSCLPALLSQALGDDTTCVFLMKLEGALIACVGQEDDCHTQVLASILSNMWSAFQKCGSANHLILDCEHSRMVACPVTDKALLCLMCTSASCAGLQRLKADHLRRHLEGPLAQLAL
eukprot:CAMPEP_0177648532 /NCGR_PEP_ID=MMETSP0447-20121125/10878_1 /TAXON_ID=0 /ORGANISM="Stygamoeba regulata, Strain BSH-02190019" /LENGTH=119 /DNA_ID=CAMNT_0019151179 /DNA_START=169 /DNA_END=528 /DNA_ORIENTATION=+